MVTLGLSPWQAWGCVWIGYTLVAPFIVLNARPGAILHVTFPVVARMSFGIWGSLWCVFNRAAMAWWVLPLVARPIIDGSRIQYLVRRPGEHRRVVRKGDAESHLAQYQRYSSVPSIQTVDALANLRGRIANGLPESAGITTRDFLCFFLFCLISLPAIWFPIHQMCVLPAGGFPGH